MAIIVSLGTNLASNHITAVFPLCLVLLLVIAVGVIFDCIGVAAIGADAAPFHARASRRAPGAAKSLKLINKADVVANVCCDVVGDVCGIVSGTLAAAVVLLISPGNSLFVSILLAAFVSALTVGGKAVMKGFAVKKANKIIEMCGILLDIRNLRKKNHN